MIKPTLLHYYVTDICNAKCEFCDIWENKDPHFAQIDDVKKNLLDAKKLGCKFVDFTGGEPLLNKNLPLFLNEAKKLGFITSVTTNTALFPKMVNALKGKIDLLHFSLDSDSPQMHDKIRGFESYDNTVKSIDIALENNLYPDLLFTFTNENINNFLGVWKLARSKKIIVILDPLFSTDGTQSLTKSTNKKAIEYGKLPGVYLNHAHLSLRKSGGNPIKKPRCKAVDSTLVILPKNQLALPCYHHSVNRIDINSNLLKIVKSEKYLYHKKNQGKLPFCEGCHINCYFDPSYSYKFDKMMVESSFDKLRYGFYKYGVYRQKMGYSLFGLV
jgi:MoaA/NifB/PqqE/SkfB family radical SAM enzyme